MYTSKQFQARSLKEIEQELISIKEHAPYIQKVFLADGNAMVLSTTRLLHLLPIIKLHLPQVRRISAYALPSDLNRKSVSELKEIAAAGLTLVYVGIESGDDHLLKIIQKGESAESIKQGMIKAKQAGIKSSVMIINGLGGKKYSLQHAKNSAALLNAIAPDFYSTLVLSYPLGIKHFKSKFKEDFIPLSPIELLEELKVLISESQLERTVFRSDHASNYLVLKGNLNKDKDMLLKQIENAIQHPNTAKLRAEWQRGL
jgi:radical SAM superfamily enzyme YgiQ (UPF0313 family)